MISRAGRSTTFDYSSIRLSYCAWRFVMYRCNRLLRSGLFLAD